MLRKSLATGQTAGIEAAEAQADVQQTTGLRDSRVTASTARFDASESKVDAQRVKVAQAEKVLASAKRETEAAMRGERGSVDAASRAGEAIRKEQRILAKLETDHVIVAAEHAEVLAKAPCAEIIAAHESALLGHDLLELTTALRARFDEWTAALTAASKEVKSEGLDYLIGEHRQSAQALAWFERGVRRVVGGEWRR